MSKSFTYIVREGDTVEDLATRFYGLPSEYPKITHANPGSFLGTDLTVFPGQKLNIPEKEVLNPQSRDEVDSGDDSVVVVVDGVRFESVWGFKLSRSIALAADTFSFQIPFDPEDAVLKATFLPFQYKTVQIFIGTVLRLTGTLVNAIPISKDDKRVINASGYSTCGVMNDCNLPTSAYPLVFRDSSLFEICRAVSQPFNIKVTDAVGDNVPFFEVDIKPKDKAYAFLAKLAKKRGFLITSDVEGNLIIQKTTDEKAKFTFNEGEPSILEIKARYKGQAGYTSITGLLEGADNDSSFGDDGFSIVDSITELASSFFSDESESDGSETDSVLSSEVLDKFNKNLRTPRPLVFQIDEIDEGNIEAAVQAKMRRLWAESISYPVVLEGWRDPSGKIWRDNQRLNIFYPSVMIYKTTEFLIKDVEISENAERKTTKMTLVLPQSYNDEPLESLPWLS